jgi:HYR domain-containing protein
MIVWGGVFTTTSPPLNSGGRYNPSNDIWTTTSQVNAPLGRREHSVVWAGNEMIVWGGYSGPTNSGARYAPYFLSPAPIAHAGPDDVVECSSSHGTPVTLAGTAESSCTDLDQISFRWSGPFPEGGGTLQGRTPTVTLPLGSSEITLEVEDAQGQKGTDSLVVVVHDTTPPLLTCPSPSPAGIECQSQYGTLIAVPPASVSDACDSAPVTVNTHGPGGADASGSYPLGQTEVEMTSMDALGNIASCAFPVFVVDTTPPHISLVPGTSLLWPPNHRMVDVAADISVTDACTSTTVKLFSIISSEPDDAPGAGDGNTSNDVQGADFGTTDTSFQLRAERGGSDSGRTYAATYTAVDESGNTSQARAFVVVPHDIGGSTEPLDLSVQESLTGTLLHWDSIAGATTYSVIRGNVRSLQLAGDVIDLGTVSCVRSGSSQSSTIGQEDGEIPLPGEAFFYLASYNDGRDSGYGSASAAKPRVSTAGGCE